MMNRKSLVGMIMIAIFTWPITAYGQKERSSDKEKIFIVDALLGLKGEKVRGPRTVRIININRIRYQVEIGAETSALEATSLVLPFIPQVPKVAGTEAKRNLKTETESFRKKFGESQSPEFQFQLVEDRLKFIETNHVVYLVSIPIADALRNVKVAADETDSLVRASDDILIKGADQIIARLPNIISKIDDAKQAPWPDEDISELLGDLAGLKTALRDISDKDWLKDNKTRYDNAHAAIDQLREKLQAVSHNNDQNGLASKFDEAQKKLSNWHSLFQAAQEAGINFFTQNIEVRCGFVFAAGKETKLKLTQKDRLAPDNNQAIVKDLVTVECSSPLSVSGGFGLSTLEEREFIFVQSTKQTTDAMGKPVQTLIQRFGFKNNSSFRTLPVLLLNTRFWEPNDTFALHASAGAAVDIKGQVGTDIEFIVGPSLSFKRVMFITPGLHVGRVAQLVGGFKIDDEVPAGVASPPIVKSWQPCFALSVTFKIR